MATSDPPEPPSKPPTDAPLDEMVASLIDERPTRPRLSVVPSPASSAAEAQPASRPTPVDDPLAAVLDQQGPKREEGELVEDAWGKPADDGAKVDLAKILDFGGLTTGLRQLAGWLEKQVPSINAAVSKFINTVEEVLTTPTPGSTSPIIRLVPDDQPAAAAAPEVVPDPGPSPSPEPVQDPEPAPDPVPIHDPEPPPDPNPGTDPLPIGDPVPGPDHSPGPTPDPLPMHDPVPPPDPNPGIDPLPIGDPIPGGPGGDPLRIGDPIASADSDTDPDPAATD